jgi:hypothetical protein
LLALSTLGDLEQVELREPLLAAVALWIKADLLVRHPEGLETLKSTLEIYTRLRPTVKIEEHRVPTPSVLAQRLKKAADELGDKPVSEWLSQFAESLAT